MGLNIGLIRESFEAVKPHAAEFVEHFYEELFTRYPQAKALFAEKKMKQQHKALVTSLAHIVEYLDDTDHLVDYLRKMGGRHVDYGTEPEHYGWVGEALLATFAYFFDDQWTDELKEQWTMAFGFIADEMCKGMEAEKTKVVEMKAKEPTLEEIAHGVASEMFRKALDEEMASPEFHKMLKEKAQQMLRAALETEAKQMLAGLQTRQKSA